MKNSKLDKRRTPSWKFRFTKTKKMKDLSRSSGLHFSGLSLRVSRFRFVWETSKVASCESPCEIGSMQRNVPIKPLHSWLSVPDNVRVYSSRTNEPEGPFRGWVPARSTVQSHVKIRRSIARLFYAPRSSEISEIPKKIRRGRPTGWANVWKKFPLVRLADEVSSIFGWPKRIYDDLWGF